MKCHTCDNKVVDKFYGNIKKAYSVRSKLPLSNSDHNTVHLLPTYKTVFKNNKPQSKIVTVRTQDSLETLKASFLYTGWDIFPVLEINEPTDTIKDYIKFCLILGDSRRTLESIQTISPTLLERLKIVLTGKKIAFRNHDRASLEVVQKELNKLLREARRNQTKQKALRLCQSCN